MQSSSFYALCSLSLSDKWFGSNIFFFLRYLLSVLLLDLKLIIQIHSNNASFCCDLLDRVFFDFSEEITEPRRLGTYPEALTYALEILGEYFLF